MQLQPFSASRKRPFPRKLGVNGKFSLKFYTFCTKTASNHRLFVSVYLSVSDAKDLLSLRS